jgi:hypothetical protein
VLVSCAKTKSERITYDEKGEKSIFRAVSIQDCMAEYGYLYYENNSVEATLLEVVHFDTLENYKMLPPDDNGFIDKLEVKLAPGESKLITMKRTERLGAFSCTYYPTMLYDEEKIWASIKTKGRKNQVSYQGEKVDVRNVLLIKLGVLLCTFL